MGSLLITGESLITLLPSAAAADKPRDQEEAEVRIDWK